jgi:hypothetical protein
MYGTREDPTNDFNNRVIPEVRRLGGENCQFQHNSPRMFLQKEEITGTQTSFSTNYGKTEFHPVFCFSGRGRELPVSA